MLFGLSDTGDFALFETVFDFDRMRVLLDVLITAALAFARKVISAHQGHAKLRIAEVVSALGQRRYHRSFTFPGLKESFLP
jgi:hypothetical protein